MEGRSCEPVWSVMAHVTLLPCGRRMTRPDLCFFSRPSSHFESMEGLKSYWDFGTVSSGSGSSSEVMPGSPGHYRQRPFVFFLDAFQLTTISPIWPYDVRLATPTDHGRRVAERLCTSGPDGGSISSDSVSQALTDCSSTQGSG